MGQNGINRASQTSKGEFCCPDLPQKENGGQPKSLRLQDNVDNVWKHAFYLKNNVWKHFFLPKIMFGNTFLVIFFGKFGQKRP